MAVDLSQLCFIDCETTGLNPECHVPWEIAVSVDDREYIWNIVLTEEELEKADPGALRVGGFYERGEMTIGRYGLPKQEPYFSKDGDPWVPPMCRQAFAWMLVQMIGKRHLVGMVPSFDERFVGDFCRRQTRPPVWHYHLIDVEPLVVGYLRGMEAGAGHSLESQRAVLQNTEPPWKSDDLSIGMGIDPGDFDRHTALGDVRWSKALYLAVMNSDG